MFGLCIIRCGFCAIFILFILNGQLYAQQDGYLYNVEDYHQESRDVTLKLQLVKSLQQRYKRQLKPSNNTIADNRSNQQFPSITTSSPLESKDVINNKTPLSQPINKTVDNKLFNKTLGVNGTGIRKNYTVLTTPHPIDHSLTLHNDDLIVPSISVNNETTFEEDEISISKFSDDADTNTFNKTLEQHNITQRKEDAHIYYNSTFIIDSEHAKYYWVDLENKTDVKVNPMLSASYRRAATVKLSFDFPFYGHLIRNVTIATGGFLYMGEYVHSWLAATQYIAPLMANFDTSLSNDSYIKYWDNGTAFTVLWERVSLRDKPNDGEFTFQTTLFNNGDIVFVYKSVPLIIEDIKDDHHPVKVGLSDAYIIDQTIFFVRRKTIYEYHRVNFYKEDIKNLTVIYLKSLPTCLDSTDCHTCLTKEIDNFQCTWCPSIGHCSNGFDRHRQDWLTKGCEKRQLTNETQCLQINNNNNNFDHSDGHEFYYGPRQRFGLPDLNNSQLNSTLNNPYGTHDTNDQNNFDRKHDDSVDNTKQDDSFSNSIPASRIFHNSNSNDDIKMGASGIISILFLVGIVLGLAVWILYAYRNPHTTSGQILIRYRPSQWSWKRGEARYTAATIHM